MTIECHNPLLDEVLLRFHVRPKNVVAIILSTPDWAIKTEKDYWYVHIEDLVNHQWVFRPGSSSTGTFAEVSQRMEQYYKKEAK